MVQSLTSRLSSDISPAACSQQLRKPFRAWLEWFDLDTNRHPSKTEQSRQIGEPEINCATNGLQNSCRELIFGVSYTAFDAESGYDSPGAWREIRFYFWSTFFLFFLLLLLVSGRTTQGMVSQSMSQWAPLSPLTAAAAAGDALAQALDAPCPTTST